VKISTQLLLLGAACLLAPSRFAVADDSKPADAKPMATTEKPTADSTKPSSSDSTKPNTKPVTSVATAAGAVASDPDALKLHLMDGSVITGRLSLKELQVETKFGMLNVPVANIRSFTPGLTSHPTLAKQISGWIEDLGSGTFNDREAAQQALVKLGPAIRAELERRRDDSDAERRTRVRAILSEFEQAQDDAEELGDKSAGIAAYIQDDTIATSEFTIVGRIVPQSFAVNSLYGPLTIKLTDIRSVDRETQKKEELPTNFTVTGAHIVFNGTLNTTIRLEKGDNVTVSSSGSIVMTPWGNQTVGPDGSTNFGLFNNNRQIPVGALVGKIGTGEDYFKIGSHHSFTADKSGVLHLGIAMRPEQSGNEFPGKYAVKIRVVRK
jgi:hypothetical protein